MTVPPIAPSPTDIAAFIGWAPKGPARRAVPVTSWAGYEQAFGGLHAGSALAYGVRHFFDNGGRRALIVRIAGRAPLPPDDDRFWDNVHPPVRARGRQGGVFLLDPAGPFNLLVVPGLTHLTRLATLAAFCRERRAILIADAPDTPDHGSIQPVAGPEASNAALYTPWVRVPDPLLGGQIASFPPSGAVAGVYARTDATRGVWKAPSGTQATIIDATGLANALTSPEADLLNARGVNTLRQIPGGGPVVWGARTCAGSDALVSEWKYVPVRRTILFIEDSLVRGLSWVVFEPNDEPLWARIRASVGAFLHDLWRTGAFAGATPPEAFFVRCDRTTITQHDLDQGIVNVVIGVAPLKPAEFVVVSLQLVAQRPRP
jgi:uncharacterized protein